MTTADAHPLAPVTVSQETCLAAYGVSPRWYLDRANAGCFPSRRAGKLVLSRPEDFLAYLQSLPPASTVSDERKPAPSTTSSIAASLGLAWGR